MNMTSSPTPGNETYSAMTSTFDVTTEVMTPTEPSGAAMTPPVDCLVIPLVPGSLPYENPEDLISYETQQIFNDFVIDGLLTALFVICVPSNVVNMIVFFKQGLKERINLCLFSLALTDLLVVGLHFVWSLDWLVEKIRGDNKIIPVYRVFVNNHIIGFVGLIYLSSFISMIIAIDRCFCVVYPFKARNILSAKAMAAFIAAAFLVIVGNHFVLSFSWRVVCIFDPLTGNTLETIFSSDFYFENKKLLQTLDSVVLGMFIPGICLAGVIISTAITVMRLHKTAAWRDKTVSASASSTLSGQDMALTRMLIGISVLFIACNTPPFIFHTAIMFVPELSLSGKYYNLYTLLINVQQALTFINSSFNFVVYYRTGTKYRKTIKEIFRCCFRVKGLARHGATTSGTRTRNSVTGSVNGDSSGSATASGSTVTVSTVTS